MCNRVSTRSNTRDQSLVKLTLCKVCGLDYLPGNDYDLHSCKLFKSSTENIESTSDFVFKDEQNIIKLYEFQKRNKDDWDINELLLIMNENMLNILKYMVPLPLITILLRSKVIPKKEACNIRKAEDKTDISSALLKYIVGLRSRRILFKFYEALISSHQTSVLGFFLQSKSSLPSGSIKEYTEQFKVEEWKGLWNFTTGPN